MKYEDRFPEIRVEFCGEKSPIFKNYDLYLKNTYGNHMQMLLEDRRVNHPPFALDLNDGKGNRIK